MTLGSLLRSNRGGEGLSRAWKDRKVAVAFGADRPASVILAGGREKLPVGRKRLCIALAQKVEKSSRPLDIGKEQGNRGFGAGHLPSHQPHPIRRIEDICTPEPFSAAGVAPRGQTVFVGWLSIRATSLLRCNGDLGAFMVHP
jgi:hypothetical protein